MAKPRVVAGGSKLIYLLPMVVSSITPLVTLPLITAKISPMGYGAWALAVAYASFVTGLANLGLTAGFERNFFAHPAPAERSALLHGILGCVAVLCLCGGLLTAIWRAEIAAWLINDQSQGPLICVAYAASAVTGLKAYYLLALRNTDDARAYAWYSIDEAVLGAVTSVTLVVGLDWGPVGLAAGQLLATVVVSSALAWRFCRSSPAWHEVTPHVRPMLRSALRISVPLTPRVFVGVLSTNFDKYILGQLTTLGGVGVYAVAQRLAYAAFQVMTAIEHMFVPEVYRRLFQGRADAAQSVGRFLTPFAVISAGVALGVVLVAEEAVAWVTDDAYAAAVPMVCLLATSYGLMFFGKVPQLTFAKKTAWTSALTLVTLVMNVIICLVAVPRWGAVGAAGATVVSGLLALALGQWLRQKAFAIEWERGPLVSAFGLLLVAGVGVATMTLVSVPYGVSLAVRLAVGLTFLALLWQLGLVGDVARHLGRRATADPRTGGLS
jgi:O-antigen/teichoic acid export membrane protein